MKTIWFFLPHWHEHNSSSHYLHTTRPFPIDVFECMPRPTFLDPQRFKRNESHHNSNSNKHTFLPCLRSILLFYSLIYIDKCRYGASYWFHVMKIDWIRYWLITKFLLNIIKLIVHFYCDNFISILYVERSLYKMCTLCSPCCVQFQSLTRAQLRWRNAQFVYDF